LETSRKWFAGLILTVLALNCSAIGINKMLDPPPGRLVDIGGRSLHINCQGEGTPTVVLDSGVGGFSLEWTLVQRLVSGKVRICAYDRAGYAWSDPGPLPRTTSQIVQELHTLLHNDGLEPPYVLVGHSFGGYNVMYYSKIYPAETAGLVLVDSSHPEQTERLPDLPARRDKSGTSNIVTFFQGQSSIAYYPDDIRPMLMHILSTVNIYRTQQGESLNFALSARQVERAGPLPDVPLMVISRGKRVWPDDPYGDALEREWNTMQRELAGFTTHGRQVIAEKSGHQIQLEQPDLVAQGILSVVNEVRASGRWIHARSSPPPEQDRRD
jgi:pimeloyl-ACP methyl ester carboxylesterase